jgi:hypothetical protein
MRIRADGGRAARGGVCTPGLGRDDSAGAIEEGSSAPGTIDGGRDSGATMSITADGLSADEATGSGVEGASGGGPAEPSLTGIGTGRYSGGGRRRGSAAASWDTPVTDGANSGSPRSDCVGDATRTGGGAWNVCQSSAADGSDGTSAGGGKGAGPGAGGKDPGLAGTGVSGTAGSGPNAASSAGSAIGGNGDGNVGGVRIGGDSVGGSPAAGPPSSASGPGAGMGDGSGRNGRAGERGGSGLVPDSGPMSALGSVPTPVRPPSACGSSPSEIGGGRRSVRFRGRGPSRSGLGSGRDSASATLLAAAECPDDPIGGSDSGPSLGSGNRSTRGCDLESRST